MKKIFWKLSKASKIATVALFAFSANAAELTSDSDLVIHPEQMATLFQSAAREIRSSATWNWAALHFEKPYKTHWTQVQAKGPFDLRLQTESLGRSELAFEFGWSDPVLSVGRFEIRDTVVREVGGARIIINLEGACANMSLRLPAAGWKIKGKLAWVSTPSGLAAQWRDFEFQAAQLRSAQVDLGQCEGPAGLHQQLKTSIEELSQDPEWLSQVLRDGVLDWFQGTLSALQVDLLKVRSAQLRQGLSLSWEPQRLESLASGVVRVAGIMALRKAELKDLKIHLPRSQEEAHLALVEESGFILPKATLIKVAEFLYQTGVLRYRTTSDDVESFQSLMQSRFLQFFVWPDLMNFPKSSKFYFDVAAAQSPQLFGGRMTSSGVAYNFVAPIKVQAWAPAGKRYLPYVDFWTPASGVLSASVDDGRLNLRLSPQSLQVQSAFRSEYKRIRPVNEWLANGVLASGVESFLADTPLSFELPEWTLNEISALQIRDVQVWKQSFRVPLMIKNNK